MDNGTRPARLHLSEDDPRDRLRRRVVDGVAGQGRGQVIEQVGIDGHPERHQHDGPPQFGKLACQLLLARVPEGVDGAQDDQVRLGGSSHGGGDLVSVRVDRHVVHRGALVAAPDRIHQTQLNRRGRVGGRHVHGCRGEHQQPGGAHRPQRQQAGVVADLRHRLAGKLHG